MAFFRTKKIRYYNFSLETPQFEEVLSQQHLPLFKNFLYLKIKKQGNRHFKSKINLQPLLSA